MSYNFLICIAASMAFLCIPSPLSLSCFSEASMCPVSPNEGVQKQIDGIITSQTMDIWFQQVWGGQISHRASDAEKAVAAEAGGEK